jgi:peptide chain release factor subunit 1
MVTYGEEDVRRSLESGAVRILLLSDGLEVSRVTLKCSACEYQEQQTVKNQNLMSFEQELSGKPCPKCRAPALGISENQDLVDNFAQLAEYTNAEVEIISSETEEGQMLKNSFGGIVAILRFKGQH